MNYTDMMKLFANKVKQYTPTQCRYALKDIEECLSIHKDDSNYVAKLNCERDILLAIYTKEYQRQLRIGF